LIECFDGFNIQVIPRGQNHVTNALALTASTLEPTSMAGLKKFSVEFVATPSVPDNITNFQVFEDDQHILNFLSSSDMFTAQIIDEEEVEPTEIDLEGVLNLKTNTIPRGMVELERLFDTDNLGTQKKEGESPGGKCDPFNLGTEADVKNVFIGKASTEDERTGIIHALREYHEVIAWSYEDLKTYDTSIITHMIPLKLGAKPFRQRQRPVNALLEPLIFKEVQKLLSAKIIFLVRHSAWVVNLVPV